MKKIETKIKLQLSACDVNPGPPVGPALGVKGVNIIKFCNEFNAKTKNMSNLKKGTLVPVIITIYKDKSFNFIIKSPPASVLIKILLNMDKGSGNPNKEKVGKITMAQLAIIAEKKNNDLIVNSKEAAINTLKGTAKSMGLIING